MTTGYQAYQKSSELINLHPTRSMLHPHIDATNPQLIEHLLKPLELSLATLGAINPPDVVVLLVRGSSAVVLRETVAIQRLAYKVRHRLDRPGQVSLLGIYARVLSHGANIG